MVERRPAGLRRLTVPDTVGDCAPDGTGGSPVPAGAGRRCANPAPSEAEGVDDMRAFIGHTVWKKAPTVHIDVDDIADLLTATFYGDLPDVEIDPGPALSVGFHDYRGEYLITSLCLYGVARWPGPSAAEPGGEAPVARALLGRSVGRAIQGLRGGGSGTVALSTTEAADLVATWCRFVEEDGRARKQR